MRSRLERLKPVGLRWRLAGWFTVVTLACTAIVFVAVYRGTASQLRHQIDAETSGDAGELSHNLLAAKARSARGVSQAARRYIQAQPFKASSTLLFAIVPGAATSTNRPELFAQPVADRGETAPEQLQEDRVSMRLLAAPYGYSTLMLPDVGDLRLLKHVVRIPGGLTVTIGVGTPLAPVSHAQRGLARAFILAGLLALACALLASFILGARLSRPLRRMAAVAARVDAGDLHPRIHYTGERRDELKVLADSFNRMLDRLTEAFAGQRAFVADASHELRTPLTVIRGQLEVLVAHDEPSPAEVRRVERLVQAEIARISRLVDDLLLLAKTEQTEFLRVQLIELRAYVGELWNAASLLADRRFELAEVPRGALQADPDRLAQALRNLIGNAIEHTAPGTGLVRMRVQALPGRRLRFLVEDDGPGIPLDQRERVFRRFHRTDIARDRASGGTGLGLAIVRAIADAHGGTVSAGESPEGGARIELELPGFTPAPGGARAGTAHGPDARPRAGTPARAR
jgi:two-component system, OmpR family, sensor kinase